MAKYRSVTSPIVLSMLWTSLGQIIHIYIYDHYDNSKCNLNMIAYWIHLNVSVALFYCFNVVGIRSNWLVAGYIIISHTLFLGSK